MLKYITCLLFVFLSQQCSDNTAEHSAVENFIEPQPFAPLPKKLKESSGLEVVNNTIYSINDSGGKPQLFVFDNQGNGLKEISIAHVKNQDWESLAANSTHFFIGDFGNNSGNRKNLSIFYFPIEQLNNDRVEADIIHFKYGNQDQYTKRKKNHSFDGEALIALDNELVIFSKDWLNQATQVYHLALDSTEDTLQIYPTDKMDVNALITGADYDAQNQKLVLCGYKNKNNFIWIFKASTPPKLLSNHVQKLELKGLHGAQVEGITFLNDHQVLISTEKTKKFNQQLWVINLKK